MPTRAQRLFKLVPVLAVALAGCGGTRFYQSGLNAEEKGDAGTAYEKYCLAAGRDNSNGIIANGLVRTRDEAAAQSEQAGLAAMDEGRYVDAWRHFMRTLDIQPDHATAPPLIRRLEREYPFVIAAAKREWILRGSVALAVPKGPVLASAGPTRRTNLLVEAPGESSAEAEPAPRKRTAPAMQPPVPIAIDSSIDREIADDLATPTRQTNARVEAPGESSAEAKPAPRKKKAPAKQPPKPIAIASSIDREIADDSATPIRQTHARVEAPGESSEAKPAPRKKKTPAKQPPKLIAIDSSIDREIADDSAAPIRQTNARVEAPGESLAEAKPAPRKRKAPPKQRPKPVAIRLPIDGEIADGEDLMAQPSDSLPMPPVYEGGFIAIHTLSLKDRRFPRMFIVVDGIRVVLKDTDSDGQADLDVFNGKKRIKKVRALEMGRSQSFQGQSGELYRLTLLGVSHKSRTVKFGVKRA